MKSVMCLEDPYVIELRDEHVEMIRSSDNLLIQLSDGLKPFSYTVMDCLRRINPNARIVIEISSIYGACDLHLETVSALNPGLIIHIGHNKYPSKLGSVPGLEEILNKTIFISAYSTLRIPDNTIKNLIGILRDLGINKVSLVGTIQHVRELPKIARQLAKKDMDVIIPQPIFNEMEKGQILGCDYSAITRVENLVRAHVLVSGGDFHYIGALLSSPKPVIKVDPYTGKVLYDPLARDKILKRRYYRILQAMDADRFGLIIGSKTGQYRPWLITALKSILENHEKSYREFIVAALSKDALLNIDSTNIDAYIVTSCPRLPIDDLSEFHKPVLTPGEAAMAIKHYSDEYKFPWL